MPVDLSRVNISLQQFQDISSGKYNAGEVKLESETELGKINNHVHRTGALDPEGREAAFSYVGAGDARPVFRLEANRGGEINVDCELEMHPAALLVGGETHELAPGATVKGSFRCSISPEERRRIAGVDLAHADTADAEAFYNRNPPEPRRLRGAYERIPDASRPNLAVAASFDILNA
ncbi:MAG: hypothetical protein II839_01565 [Kiritimatiellae bacterium]|nr:hypothetical protein [Kiritimatiellia bacterium]